MVYSTLYQYKISQDRAQRRLLGFSTGWKVMGLRTPRQPLLLRPHVQPHRTRPLIAEENPKFQASLFSGFDACIDFVAVFSECFLYVTGLVTSQLDPMTSDYESIDPANLEGPSLEGCLVIGFSVYSIWLLSFPVFPRRGFS